MEVGKGQRLFEPEFESVGLDAVQIVTEESLVPHESELLVETQRSLVGHFGLKNDL